MPVIICADRTERESCEETEFDHQCRLAVVTHPHEHWVIILRGRYGVVGNDGPHFVKRHHAITNRCQRKRNSCGQQQPVKRIGEFLGALQNGTYIVVMKLYQRAGRRRESTSPLR